MLEIPVNYAGLSRDRLISLHLLKNLMRQYHEYTHFTNEKAET